MTHRRRQDLVDSITALGERGRAESSPSIDVSAGVDRALSELTRELPTELPRLDLVPLAFGAGALATAALTVISSISSLETLLGPWLAYLLL